MVSITPIAVVRDSRTFKQAASLARFGYRSIVVEGEASELQAQELPFELIPIPGAQRARDPVAGAGPAGGAPEPERSEERPESDTPTAPRETDPDQVDFVRRRWRAVRAAWYRWRPRARLLEVIANLQWRWRWSRSMYEALPGADLYIAHSFPVLPSVLLKAARTRTPLSYDAHDAYFEMNPDRRGLWVWGAIERLGVRRARKFATVSTGLAAVLEERFGRRPEVIRNCHELRLDREVERDLRAVTGVGAGDCLLVMVGQLKPGTAVREGLLALRQLPERVHLAFVGRGHDRSRELVDQLGLDGRVHLVEPVPTTDVISFIRGADASVLLYRPVSQNYLYGLPNGFFNAVAAGLPLLYPALVEIEALARRYQLGARFDPSEPDSIAAAIRSLLDDPDAAARYRAGAERARQELNWENEEVQFRRLIESAIDGRVPATPRPRATVG